MGAGAAGAPRREGRGLAVDRPAARLWATEAALLIDQCQHAIRPPRSMPSGAAPGARSWTASTRALRAAPPVARLAPPRPTAHERAHARRRLPSERAPWRQWCEGFGASDAGGDGRHGGPAAQRSQTCPWNPCRAAQPPAAAGGGAGGRAVCACVCRGAGAQAVGGGAARMRRTSRSRMRRAPNSARARARGPTPCRWPCA